MRRWVPWAMVWLRVLLCPTVMWAAHAGRDGRWMGAIVFVALVDDIVDGVLARRWGSDTTGLRMADSCADTVFYLGVAGALWLRKPQVLQENGWLLAGLFGLEGVRYGFDFWKFGKAASYHSYLAKFWGLVMAVALISLLTFGGLAWLLRVSIWVGIVANAEGLLMSALLPRWKNDVKTLGVAWRLRREMLARNVAGWGAGKL